MLIGRTMFDIRLPELRPYAFEGNFGLERESLRVTEAGRMAQTPHPFPPDHPRIVREVIGFLLAILVAHLLEPLAAPISHRVIEMSDDGRLPHIGLLTFLGINLTAILVVFIGAVIRFASNVIGEFFGNRLTRWFRHRNTT